MFCSRLSLYLILSSRCSPGLISGESYCFAQNKFEFIRLLLKETAAVFSQQVSVVKERYPNTEPLHKCRLKNPT